MATLPYMVSAKQARKILEKIKEAPTPPKFTKKYLGEKLGFSGANDVAFISYAKHLDLLDSAGAPTELYKRFRNPRSSEIALAEALMIGYKPLYERNERFFDLNKEELHELVCKETGYDHDNITAKRITNTFMEVKQLANFDRLSAKNEGLGQDEEGELDNENEEVALRNMTHHPVSSLGLSFNINLVLPNTDDPKVFDAIFRSLKDILL